jgi:hypothetical protein
MITARTDVLQTGTRPGDVAELEHERWHEWPVNWTAVWVGALAGLCAALIFGLIGVSIGAHLLTPEHRVVDLHKMHIGTMIYSVCAAFFAFVIAGWVTGKIAGILRAEPAVLHGAVAWLVAVPMLALAMALGAGSFLGGWYAGLAGSPSWAAPAAVPFEKPEPPGPAATSAEVTQYRADLAAYHNKVHQWNEDTPRATRNSALGAMTALLLGLIGSVIGGWLACGEPMSLTYHRVRREAHGRPA